jgi:hypothetical protein
MKTVVRALAASLVVIGLTACGGGSSGGPASSPSPSGSGSTVCSSTNATYKSPPATLPARSVALTKSAPPWGSPLLTQPQQTADYVAAAGLPCLGTEMLQVHYHAHVDINVDGKAVVVPQYLGFVAQGNAVAGLAPLHTHDDTGIIHIENNVTATFYLGQVFIEWGVRFTPTCLGPYCAGKGKELAVFVDGTRYTGDPTKLVLKMHQEIAIEYGDTGKLPKPPASYAFPSGL